MDIAIWLDQWTMDGSMDLWMWLYECMDDGWIHLWMWLYGWIDGWANVCDCMDIWTYVYDAISALEANIYLRI
jgi:hypothetical protein